MKSHFKHWIRSHDELNTHAYTQTENHLGNRNANPSKQNGFHWICGDLGQDTHQTITAF